MKRRGNKRRRVSRDQVRQNAKDGFGGGSKFYKLPEGVRDWRPDKPGTYLLNIVPYEVSSHSHPDGVDKSRLWYKRGFRVHHTDDGSYVCPKSMNKEDRCPWCEMFFKLKKKHADKDMLQPFSGQMMEAYNVLDPEDENKETVAVFCMSYGKFSKKLKEELEQADEKDLLFFDVTKDGRTLKVRFSEKKFAGNKFLECTKIDFRPRKSMDEDAIFEKVVDLDKFLKILPYEKLKKIFETGGSGDDEKPSKKKGKLLKMKKKGKKTKLPEKSEVRKPKLRECKKCGSKNKRTRSRCRSCNVKFKKAA